MGANRTPAGGRAARSSATPSSSEIALMTVILARYDFSDRSEGTGCHPEGNPGPRESASGRPGRDRVSRRQRRSGRVPARKCARRKVCRQRDGRPPARRPGARAAVTVCLDAWAVLAWLDGDEPAVSRIERALADRPVISWINLVEVYCRIERDHGREAADETLRSLRASLAPALALGDSFAIATAAAHGLALLTGDPEIIELAEAPCDVEDLRPGQ